MMRALAMFALVACSKPKVQQQPAAPPSQCPRVADHVVSLMSGAQKYPAEATDPFRRVVSQRCEQDRWSEGTQKCLLEITALDQGQRCQQMMTPQQVEAFHRDSEAALADLHSQMHDAPSTPGSPSSTGRPLGPRDGQ